MKRLTFLFLFLAIQVNANYIWIQKTSMPTVGRFNATSFAIGNNLYVGTGYFNGVGNQDFWMYNAITEMWTQIADLPAPRTGASGFAYNDFGYVAFGYSNSPWFWSPGIYQYDPLMNLWTAKTPLPAAGRYGNAVFVINDKAYFAGGNLGSASGPYTDETWCYDIPNDSWSSVAPIPGSLRYLTKGFSSTGFGYAGGGAKLVGGNYTFFDTFFKYDPANNLWSSIPPYPAGPFSAMSAIELGNQTLVGTGGNANMGVFSNLFYFLDHATDTWSPGPSLPISAGRSAGYSSAMAGTGFIGGGNYQGVYQNDLWQLVSTTSIANYHDDELMIYVSNNVLMIENSRSEKNSLIIYDLSGRTVLRDVDIHNNYTLKLEQGIYIIYFTENNSSEQNLKVYIN